MTVASFIIACLAVITAAAAAWYARGQKQAAEAAAVEAKRSADAAAAVAKIEQDRRADELADADRVRIVFDLEHQNKSAYLLRNLGTDTAYGVRVDAGDLIARGESDLDEFASGEVQKYFLVKKMGSTDHIVVSWHHQQDRSDMRRSAKLYLNR